MALHPPSQYAGNALAGLSGHAAINPLDHEIAAEKAAALGRAGERVQKSLLVLRETSPDDERGVLLKAAADAV